MTRIVSQDFSQLRAFLNTYSLSSVCNDTDYTRLLSHMHKRYFSLLALLAELETDGYSHIKSLYKLDEQSQTKLANYLKEAISDLGLALFSWTHGAYKSSRSIMRSSIENTIRALSVLEDPSICAITVTPNLFEKASQLDIFDQGSAAHNLSALKGDYTALCRDVHTADVAHMQQLSALQYFPTFHIRKAEETATLFAHLAQRILIALCLSFREFLFRMHHTNQDIVFPSLPRPIKREIQKL